MPQLIVGVADARVCRGADASLVTYALGSCIAVGVCDPAAAIGGMVHYMLPDSGLDAAKAEQNPWMFADTGIPLLFQRVMDAGGDRRRLKVWAAGGSQVMDSAGVFNIGKRNHLAMRKLLWKVGAMVSGEDVGGNFSRTVRLDLGKAEFWLRIPGLPERKL
jgi:chemotaxis protein CheD